MSYIISSFSRENDSSFMRWAQSPAPKQPSKGCVLIGVGWAEWLEKYAPIAEEWNERGFDCVVLEWRGQGLSSRYFDDRTRGWHPSYEPILDDIDAFVNNYFKDDPGPVFIMGHSLGAHLMLRWYLEKNPPLHIIKGVMLMSLMQQPITGPVPYEAAEIIAHTFSSFGAGRVYALGEAGHDPAKKPFAENNLTHDEARYNAMVMALRENPLLKSGGVTYGWLSAAFHSVRTLGRNLERGVNVWRGPYLVLGPEDDPIVRTSAMKWVAAHLPNCVSEFFSGAKHELLQETETVRPRVWKAIDRFIAHSL